MNPVSPESIGKTILSEMDTLDCEKCKVSPGDNRNISCLHHGEQASACPIMQQTTIYHCPLDGVTAKI
ncbi:hypothetical protein AKG39_01095 [Acetobacterium bakii]|uniref:Uncharacterized protein n=2 Tax=Acetobacterium bakii TaxID=52689 RepID=A0A0L6U6A9_9FIRM|nr:hypothetical protein [Acetobacterium bakii]KNZ43330.1 hypothetical protein AKG39_01095 [Acetobacterium bakii]